MARSPAPFDALLAPAPVTAILVLLLNDHLLKGALGSTSWAVVTGKLSDVAGLAFFPLLLWTLVEAFDRRRPFHANRRALWTCIGVTAVVFGATKTIPFAADAYRWSWGAMQLPFRWLLSGASTVRPVRLVMDPTDLFALPALGIAAIVGERRCRAQKNPP
jgi:hypothetical protein